MRDLVTTLLELAGMTAVTVGVLMVSIPAGVIIGGACLLLIGFLGGRKQ